MTNCEICGKDIRGSFSYYCEDCLNTLRNQNCEICGKDTNSGEFYCKDCLNTLSGEKCKICGENLYYSEGDLCYTCYSHFEAEAECYDESEEDYESKLKTVTFLHEVGATIEEIKIVTKLTEEEIYIHLEQTFCKAAS